jgi:hypothetical protein
MARLTPESWARNIRADDRDNLAAMSLFDPQRPWRTYIMLAFGFVAIAVVAFAAGWLVGTTLKPWQWLG